MVRFRPAAAQRLGMGPGLSEGLRCRCGRASREGKAVHVWARDYLSRTAARHVQVPVQRNLLWTDGNGEFEREVVDSGGSANRQGQWRIVIKSNMLRARRRIVCKQERCPDRGSRL